MTRACIICARVLIKPGRRPRNVYVYPRLHACTPNTGCLSYRLATILRSSSAAVMAKLSRSLVLPSSPAPPPSSPPPSAARCIDTARSSRAMHFVERVQPPNIHWRGTRRTRVTSFPRDVDSLIMNISADVESTSKTYMQMRDPFLLIIIITLSRADVTSPVSGRTHRACIVLLFKVYTFISSR